MNNSETSAETTADKSGADEVTTSSHSSANTTVVRSPYYTPQVDEFHIGFEYEICSNDHADIWEKSVFDGTERFDVIESQSSLFRVKHIDKEDCLSLGLELKIWDNGSGYFQKGNYTIGIYGTGLFCTVSKNDYGNNIMRFSGDLKNKSELKRILEQVGCVQR